MAHFIPTKEEITAKDVADLYVQHIFHLHGILSRTVRLVNREPPKMGLQSLPGKLLRVNTEG
jgi:hypothetical protein